MGQLPCGAEVKLLLDPSDPPAVAKSLTGGVPASGRVILYDTDARDLLAHGIILRVRQGTSTDLTVKLRLPDETKLTAKFGKQAALKCELDYAGGAIAYSYSVQVKLTAEVPMTGAELGQQLTESQRRLLHQSGYGIDWGKVKPVPDIRSTDWTITKPPDFDKLILELWEWPGGSVLELSTKADAATLTTTYDLLRRLAAAKGLALGSTQRFKTELVLQSPSQ